MLVRILKFWEYPDLLRQTPGGKGVWNNIQFLVDEPGEADYVVIHGHAREPAWVRCPQGHVWLVMGEAPHEWADAWHDISRGIDRAYMTDARRVSEKHRLSYLFLPWWVDRDYDYLSNCAPHPKTEPLSWITSNSSGLEGHRYRLRYLEKVRKMNELSLYGSGFNPLPGKWEGLAPYRYSIAFENHSNSHYWSEKVMDCFLSWTMPIYYGCTELDRFFPRESFIQLDAETPNPTAFLSDIINSDLRERNLDAIAEARRRVLNDYNLFNVLSREIEANEEKYQAKRPGKRARLILDHTASLTQVLPKWARSACRTLKPMLTGRS